MLPLDPLKSAILQDTGTLPRMAQVEKTVLIEHSADADV
jgi:hypothetical protein